MTFDVDELMEIENVHEIMRVVQSKLATTVTWIDLLLAVELHSEKDSAVRLYRGEARRQRPDPTTVGCMGRPSAGEIAVRVTSHRTAVPERGNKTKAEDLRLVDAGSVSGLSMVPVSRLRLRQARSLPLTVAGHRARPSAPRSRALPR